MASGNDTARRLRTAFLSVKRGRTKVVPLGTKLSISAVAREAGVTPALLHNKYPLLVAEIREATGKGSVDKEARLRQRVAELEKKNAGLRDALEVANKKIGYLNSRNFEYFEEVRQLRLKYPSDNIIPMAPRRTRRPHHDKPEPEDL